MPSHKFSGQIFFRKTGKGKAYMISAFELPDDSPLHDEVLQTFIASVTDDGRLMLITTREREELPDDIRIGMGAEGILTDGKWRSGGDWSERVNIGSLMADMVAHLT